MAVTTASAPTFRGDELIRALDERRQEQGLTWNSLAVELWQQSATLNGMLGDDALCSGALYRTSVRQTMTCQYAMPLLRWLDRPPEDFLDGDVADVGVVRLPDAGPESRLRWDLPELYRALDERRRERDLTWVALGAELGCTPNRLTNLKTARLADLGLVMQITQWLGAASSGFIHAVDW